MKDQTRYPLGIKSAWGFYLFTGLAYIFVWWWAIPLTRFNQCRKQRKTREG